MKRDKIEELTRVEKEIACYIYKLSKYTIASVTFGTLFKPDTHGIFRGDKNVNIGLFSRMIGFKSPVLRQTMTLLENKDICKDYDQIDEELREIWDETSLPSCLFGDDEPLYLPEHMMEYVRSYYKDRMDLNYTLRIDLTSGKGFTIDYKTFCEALVEYNRINYLTKWDRSVCLTDAKSRFRYLVYKKDIESIGIEQNFSTPYEYGLYRRI